MSEEHTPNSTGAEQTPEHFDVIIIGSGSGNTIANPSNKGVKFAIVEKGRFGGTCSNVGCIPTKMFVHPADVAREMQELSDISLKGSFEGVDWPDLVDRVFGQRIDPMSKGGEKYRAEDQELDVTLFRGEASFVDAHTITISATEYTSESQGINASAPAADNPLEPVTITADQIVLATGGRPFIPEVIADSGVRYRTNEDVMRLPELPRSLTVLGGGTIAAEFAHVFSSLGSKVTVINRSPKLLRKLDDTISDRFNEIAAERWDLKLGRTLESVREEGDQVVVTLDDGSEVASDELLVALGRVNNSDTLNLPAAGVDTAEDGRILTDEYGRTSVPHIWALGDASSPYELKHVANAEARVVTHNLTHPDDLKTMNHRVVPEGVFTNPQIATVGLSEAEAREAELPITVKVQKFGDVAFGWAMEDTTGLCKLIANAQTGQLLGAHIIGPQASTLIQLAVTMMTFNIDARVMAKNQYWPHPGLVEVMENALLGLEFTGAPDEELWP